MSDDPKRKINAFAAHLSVGQWGQTCRPKSAAAAAAAQQAQEELQAAWTTDLEFEVASVALISRKGNTDPFTIRYLIDLGGGNDGGGGSGSAVHEVNEPYVVP